MTNPDFDSLLSNLYERLGNSSAMNNFLIIMARIDTISTFLRERLLLQVIIIILTFQKVMYVTREITIFGTILA